MISNQADAIYNSRDMPSSSIYVGHLWTT